MRSRPPERTWIDGGAAAHPGFERLEDIDRIDRAVKAEVDGYLARSLLDTLSADRVLRGVARDLGSDVIRLGTLLVRLVKYGRITFVSRVEAARYESLFATRWRGVEAYFEYVRASSLAIRWTNRAVQRFVLSPLRRRLFTKHLVPHDAFATVNASLLRVRRSDWAPARLCSAPQDSPLYDLHDFSHFVTASLEPRLYGNTYEALASLPSELLDLIRSRDLHGPTCMPYADGVLYSELLTRLYEEHAVRTNDDEELVQVMAAHLSAYLLGRVQLQHPSSNRCLSVASPPGPLELAVLVTNKFYELPASEMEQQVFFRSGTQSEDLQLHGMGARQTVEWILSHRDRFGWFERRNTMKHRAHRLAYMLVAETLAQSASTPAERRAYGIIRLLGEHGRGQSASRRDAGPPATAASPGSSPIRTQE